MKILHISIITIVAIVIISVTSVGVFIGKINDYQQQPYLAMIINGLKENYTINEPISFSVTLEGYGMGCGDTMASITKENDSSFQSLGWASQPDCISTPSLHNFKFNSISANTKINQTGNYLLTVIFDDHFEHQKTVTKRFTVMEPSLNQNKFNVSTECEIKFKPKEFRSGTFPNGTSYTVNYVPVFLLKPNSIGKICMSAWSYDKSSVFTIENRAGISKDNSETPDISVVPYPANIVIDNTNRTIVYTITTSKEAYGFYRLNTNFNFCGGGFPLAIGYDSSHLFDNDFPWLWETYPCPFNSSQQANTQVIGLTGIDVAYIVKEYH